VSRLEDWFISAQKGKLSRHKAQRYQLPIRYTRCEDLWISLPDLSFALIKFSLAELFYRPARFKPIQIDKTPGSVHHLPLYQKDGLFLLFTEGEDVYYWQYAHGIKDEQTDKPDKVSISACSPQGYPLPRRLPDY
jgi:hypothetical protein